MESLGLRMIIIEVLEQPRKKGMNFHTFGHEAMGDWSPAQTYESPLAFRTRRFYLHLQKSSLGRMLTGSKTPILLILVRPATLLSGRGLIPLQILS